MTTGRQNFRFGHFREVYDIFSHSSSTSPTKLSVCTKYVRLTSKNCKNQIQNRQDCTCARKITPTELMRLVWSGSNFLWHEWTKLENCVCKTQVMPLCRARGGRVVRLSWINVQCRSSYNLDGSWARAYGTCNRCGWGCLDVLSLSCLFSPLIPSLWKTARYRLK